MKEKDIDELAKSVGVIVEKIMKLILDDGDDKPERVDNSEETIQQKDPVQG